MENFVLISEDRISEIVRTEIRNEVGKFFKVEKKIEPLVISGTKNAVRFLSNKGFEISDSLFTKRTAKGEVPCRRFHNKRLIFSSNELLNWADKQCEPVGQNDAALTLAADAHRKLKGGHK